MSRSDAGRMTLAAAAIVVAVAAGVTPPALAQDRTELLRRRHAAAAARDKPIAARTAAAPKPAHRASEGHTSSPGQASHGATAAAPNAAAVWDRLMDGNRRFVAGHLSVHPLVTRRRELAAGQHPQAIVLSCSDSRVPPELVFDAGLGELFVVRTAGNVADPVALGSLEYAVEHLHAPLLVVLGHEKCGAVAAAASSEPIASPNLLAIVGRIRPAVEKLSGCFRGDHLQQMAVDANVHQSVENLLAESAVLRGEIAARTLTVVKALYRLERGEVVRLP